MATDWLCSLVPDHGDIDDDGDDDDDDPDNDDDNDVDDDDGDDDHGESCFFHSRACRKVMRAIQWREGRLGEPASSPRKSRTPS